MLINFFFALKKARIPVSITELLHLPLSFVDLPGRVGPRSFVEVNAAMLSDES